MTSEDLELLLVIEFMLKNHLEKTSVKDSFVRSMMWYSLLMEIKKINTIVKNI
jgi:hypothetical protein